jgi:class 3 adenylate cyclase
VSFPAGTVTFLFTDIEGSTQLMRELGDSYGALLDDHRRILREHVEEAGGREIDRQGDAFFFCFARARDAVAAAVAAQRALRGHDWPHGAQVQVRMGLHTGEPAVGSEGYHGLDVVRAARICSAGTGGQILLSETTRALVGNELPPGVEIHDLGRRELKDVQEERVFELSVDGEAKGLAVRPRSGKTAVDSFGDELSRRIESYVTRKLEEALTRALPPEPPASAR